MTLRSGHRRVIVTDGEELIWTQILLLILWLQLELLQIEILSRLPINEY